MSKKPLKISERKQLEEVMQRKRKSIETLHRLPPYTIIFSEGTKTEPHYIQGFTKQINSKYAPFVRQYRIIVIGTGRSTQSLLEYARNTVTRSHPDCKEVWLMYDKDDFPSDGFDNTQFSAEAESTEPKYHVAWSNECIELWFVLHFQKLFAHVSRAQYQDILNRYFTYEKNLENIYDLLKDNTEVAISHAKELYSSYEADAPPSQRTPATRVYELVMFLQEYL